MALIDSWKSNGRSEENIEDITKPDSNFSPTFVDHHFLLDINFYGNCLMNNISIPIYFYALSPWLRNKNLNTDFTLGNCLFRSVKVTKNTDPDKYVYTCYSIGFDSRSNLSLPDGSMGKNIIIF